jgi:hypothetical protein
MTVASLAKIAMAMFVSSRNLPLIWIDLLTSLFDRLRYDCEIRRVDHPSKPNQGLARCAAPLEGRKCASEVQDPALFFGTELFELLQ